jgi:PPM family protein phosphatase
MNLRERTSRSGNEWSPLSVDVAAASHCGYLRETNEDHYLTLRFGRSLHTIGSNLGEGLLRHNFEFTGYGMFVADGLGGMSGGEVASSMALATLVELVADTPDWILALRNWQDANKLLERVTKRFIEIDKTIRLHANRNQLLEGMGTTLTVAGTLGSDLIIGHVGDSRAYLLTNNNLNQLTTDHTLTQSLVDAGVIKPEDSVFSSMRHVLTAALGSLGNSEPQVYRLHVQTGDRLLLCTDGLTDMVSDENIALVLRDTVSAHRACHDLIDAALVSGGADNVTVIVADFGPPVSTNKEFSIV